MVLKNLRIAGRARWRQLRARWLQRKIVQPIVAVVVGLGLAILLVQTSLEPLEFIFYDLGIQLKPRKKSATHVALVKIDGETVRALSGEPKAVEHFEVLRSLIHQKPFAILYVYNPQEIKGSPAQIQKLVELAAGTPNLYFVQNSLPRLGQEGIARLAPPFEAFPVFAGPLTSDQASFAKDGSTRRLIFSYEGLLTIHPILARSFNGLDLEEDYRGLFKYKTSSQIFIDFREPGAFPALSFLDLLEAHADEKAQEQLKANALKGKIVIVGRDTKEISEDYIRTPISHDVDGLNVAEAHANILETLIDNSAVERAAKFWIGLITALMSLLTIYIVLTMRPTFGLLTLLVITVAVSGLAFVCFSLFGVWISLAHPLLAIFVSYYFFIPYRLIRENQRSFEYFQRNRLLTQVEELKSNFLRMMSHDLKTPLARIEGMTQLLLNSSSDLTDLQINAVESISQSSQELSDFIGSVLSLGRIESQEVKLHLKSRDINSLLSEVIRKCEYLAKRKNIEITTDFEPMFSIRVDEDLIRQVFTNLIENAIKYSSDGSRILIATEEIDGKVFVEVADQGIGISPSEQVDIFGKFYRSKDHVASGVPGSGLGLYLAKYFVELHNGQIALESEPGKGSTFTVGLPL